jgi:predicted dithiol-disulfide oxidoreductase (DUF899 family)
MGISFPGESGQYRVARNRLLEREAELRRLTEAVAAERRALPPGGTVPQDYVFQESGPDGSPAQVRLSELFAPGRDSLVIYNFMFPRALDEDLLYAPSEPGQDPRHGDTIDPLWNLFDFTPDGRGTDWYPELSYS